MLFLIKYNYNNTEELVTAEFPNHKWDSSKFVKHTGINNYLFNIILLFLLFVFQFYYLFLLVYYDGRKRSVVNPTNFFKKSNQNNLSSF